VLSNLFRTGAPGESRPAADRLTVTAETLHSLAEGDSFESPLENRMFVVSLADYRARRTDSPPGCVVASRPYVAGAAGRSRTPIPSKAGGQSASAWRTYALAETVREFLAGRSANTKDAYERDLGDYLRWCEQAAVDVFAAGRADVADYLDSLVAKGRAPATVARRLAALRGFYEIAVEDGLVAVSPTRRMRARKVRDQMPPAALTQGELTRLLQAADHPGTSPRLCGLTWLLAGTGIRIGEACAVQVSALDWQLGRPAGLTVTTKGGRSHHVWLDPQVCGRLEPLIYVRGEGYLFVTRTGRPWDRNNAARALQSLALEAGIETPVSPHVLRHTFVTLARQAGCGLEDVQDAVGHADVRTTRRYDSTVLTAEHHPATRILPRLR
jgi:integrase/recombinase XerD